VLDDEETLWQRIRVCEWYGRRDRELEIATGTAVWYHAGLPVVPLRWVLVRDPEGKLEPKAYLCTEVALTPVQILGYFVRRWQVEVTFAEVRRHLGGGEPAAVVRSGDRPHHPLPAGALLRGYPRRGAVAPAGGAGSSPSRLVRNGGADLQRRHRGCSSPPLAPTDFFHVYFRDRDTENPSARVGTAYPHACLRRVMDKVEV
jgi:hypothetical protein